jgi:hypothetical protein
MTNRIAARLSGRWKGHWELAGMLLASLLAAGCAPSVNGPADSFGIDFTPPPNAPVKGAVLFFIDGVNASVFQELLDANELPAFKRYFVDRGLYVTRAIGSTPSVTLANEVSVVTGRLPGHHNITGVTWFDRNQLIYRDYRTIAQKDYLDRDYQAPTLYERLVGQTTYSDFYQAHRGATKWVEDWASAGPPFFFGWYEYIDRLTLWRLKGLMDLSRQRGQFPAFIVVYQLLPDFRGYRYGPGSPQYRQALRTTDRQLGRVLGDMERAGILDKLVIAVTSDHGMTPVSRHFDLERYLGGSAGLDVASRHLWENQSFESRQRYYGKFSTVVYGTGYRYVAICLRRPLRREGRLTGWAAWTIRPSAQDIRDFPIRGGQAKDLIQALVSQPAVDLAAYAVAPNRIRVCSDKGEVEFFQKGGRGQDISYRLITGADPLGYLGAVPAELTSGQPASPARWLEATAQTDYPDLPTQMVAYFRAPRAGDIAVFARSGWDFEAGVLAGGHGGQLTSDVQVPLLLAGPGVPYERRTTARSVDLPATLLFPVGLPAGGLDGVNLLETPKSAAAKKEP